VAKIHDEHDKHKTPKASCKICVYIAEEAAWNAKRLALEAEERRRLAAPPAPARPAPRPRDQMASPAVLARLRRGALERKTNSITDEVMRGLDPYSAATWTAEVMPPNPAGHTPAVASQPIPQPVGPDGKLIKLDERVLKAINARRRLAELDHKRTGREIERAAIDGLTASTEEVSAAWGRLGVHVPPNHVLPTQQELEARQLEKEGRDREVARLRKLPRGDQASEVERRTRAGLNNRLAAAREGGVEFDARKLSPSEFALYVKRLGLTGGGTPYSGR
jgi:hypothetical protein